MTADKAVIWDMDGVIVDTARYHFESWRDVFNQRGVRFSQEDFKRNFGRRNDAIIKYALGEGVAGDQISVIAKEKEEYFRKAVAPNVKPLPGAVALIKALAGHGFKQALASSAPVANIRLLLGGLGIADYFQQIASGHEVAESKPSPQLFLLAAQKLGVPAARCIVIEDAVAGVAAAKRAGMRCVAVTNSHPQASLAEADLIVASLTEVGVSDLARLIGPQGIARIT